jgi:hypothetical protein
MPKNTRLPGHGLRSEGMPYLWADWGEGPAWRQSLDWRGYGLCSCGATSEVLASNGARKRWHADHKDEVRAALAASPDSSKEG